MHQDMKKTQTQFPLYTLIGCVHSQLAVVDLTSVDSSKNICECLKLLVFSSSTERERSRFMRTKKN